MKDRITRVAVGALAVLCLSAAGCSVLAPQRDLSRFFTLTPMPEAQILRGETSRQASGATNALTYGLGPIRLPAYLDRNAVASRVSPTQVVYSERDRWAEPLQANVPRVLLQNLSALLDTDRIALHPWSGSITIDYQIEADILRFEHDATGKSQLIARWAIKDGHTGDYPVIRKSNLTRPGKADDTAASVAALSGTLGDLSQEITAALRDLQAKR
jgi:uncharacterized lipoprotein YmbA